MDPHICVPQFSYQWYNIHFYLRARKWQIPCISIPLAYSSLPDQRDYPVRLHLREIEEEGGDGDEKWPRERGG